MLIITNYTCCENLTYKMEKRLGSYEGFFQLVMDEKEKKNWKKASRSPFTSVYQKVSKGYLLMFVYLFILRALSFLFLEGLLSETKYYSLYISFNI